MSGARVDGAATEGAGMMAELNPVPFGRCRGRWRERKHRTVPTIGKSARRLFVPVDVCNRWGYNEPRVHPTTYRARDRGRVEKTAVKYGDNVHV